MSRRSPLSYFRQALVVALAAVPACGGTTETLGGGGDDAGATDGGHASDGSLPSTPCNWAVVPLACGGCNPSCEWGYSFQGDPATCAGFTSAGTPAQCAALCGDDTYGDPSNRSE